MIEREWRYMAAAASRFAVASQRLSQLRIASTIVRPYHGLIPEDAFLADLQYASRARTRDLIYGRYLAAKPLARAVAVPSLHAFRAERHSGLAALEATLDPLVARSQTHLVSGHEPR